MLPGESDYTSATPNFTGVPPATMEPEFPGSLWKSPADAGSVDVKPGQVLTLRVQGGCVDRRVRLIADESGRLHLIGESMSQSHPGGGAAFGSGHGVTRI